MKESNSNETISDTKKYSSIESEKDQAELIEKQSRLAEIVRKLRPKWNECAPFVATKEFLRYYGGILEPDYELLKVHNRTEERANSLEYRDRSHKNLLEAYEFPLETKNIKIDQEAIALQEKFIEERKRAKSQNNTLDWKKLDSIAFDFLKKRFDEFATQIETMDINDYQRNTVLRIQQAVQDVIEKGKLPDGQEAPRHLKEYPGVFLMNRIEAIESTTQRKLF